MPARRLTMRKLKETLRLKFEKGLKHRQIAAACRISAGTVSDIFSRFRASGLKWNEGLTDEQLTEALYPKVNVGEQRPEPDWSYVHRELRRKDLHMTRALLWEEYKRAEAKGYGYSMFCDLYGKWLEKVEPVMRQVHKFGEKCFVDFAGDTVPIYVDGQVRQAQLFVGVLGGSNYTYCDLSWSQSMPDWIELHNRMLGHFGGCPEIIVPDNLKSGVTKACHYEPSVNLTYEEFAKHNGVAVVPTRARKPKDKAKVENAVLHVERQVLARLRNRTFYSLQEAKEAVFQEMATLNNKPFQKLPESRQAMFEKYERPVLRPLPKRPFEFGEWKARTVGVDYHLEFEGSHYSVPFELCKERVEIRVTSRVLEVLHGGVRVALHERAKEAGQTFTKSEHMPPNHRFYHDFNVDDAREKLERPGPYSRYFLEALLNRELHDEQRKRLCQGLLKSLRAYSHERYESACQRGLRTGAISCDSIASILKLGLDRAELDSVKNVVPIGHHENVRGSDYYRKAEAV